MPGVDPPSSVRHRDAVPMAEDGDVEPGDGGRDTQLLLDLFQPPLLPSSSPLELTGEENQRDDASWSPDGDVERCGLLERKWMLWHEFMKDHDQLAAWLQLAEQAVTSLNSAHVTYNAAKEELRKFERLRCEAGGRLVQLDSLTRKNRTLTRLFQGNMQARLLASARECGRRWDELTTKLESITGRLQLFVSEWEEFEAEREELALWLADMDVRLTEIEHLTGSTCEKLRRLQSFQQCVCENSSRVNALLQRGEALIQRSDPADAQHVESRLLELLRRCSHVYNIIARMHTRLLSMRLVFEDDWILSQATDSGCPSETLQEEEGAFDKHSLDHFKDFRAPFNPTPPFSSEQPSPLHHPPPPPSPSSPAHEHMGLEWDPSVDIGRSVSHDDADSSYFSASTGLGHRDDLKRWSYLGSLDSRSDISTDITNQEADVGPGEWLDHAHPGFFPPVAANQERAVLCRDQWMTSTPDRDTGEPIGFDGGRVKAWLRVQSSAPPEGTASCSKAVQTDGQPQRDGSLVGTSNQLHHRYHDDTLQLPPTASISLSRDLAEKPCLDCVTYRHQSDIQAEEESSCCEETERLLSDRSVDGETSSSRAPPSSPPLLSPAILCLLLAVAVALLGSFICVAMEPPCHRSNRMSQGLHFVLRYVNGPPPT